MVVLPGLLGSLLILVFGGQVLYILMLTIASFFYRKPKEGNPISHRFVILIPAYNESLVLPTMLGPIKALRAGPESPEPIVVVIADNCTDNTAELAREAGAVVYERQNLSKRGKGYALEWAIQKLPQDFPDYTACIILDADTLPDSNFVKAVDVALNRGVQVIQGRYDVLKPFENWRTLMMFMASVLANHIRPLGRTALGLSDGLRGNGMVFRREVLEQVPWKAYGLVEDIEYGTQLIKHGYRIEYVPDAIIYGQAPKTEKQALSQRLRWEGGRGAQARKDIPPLLRLALQKRSFTFLDRAIDLMIPPLTLLVMIVTGVVFFNLAVWKFLGGKWLTRNLGLSLATFGGLVLYVVGGLLRAKVPAKTFLMLAFTPFYLLWKIKVYLLLLIRRSPTEWVRTDRTSVEHQQN